MKIGLIDVDGHNFPNLCLMKISAYHKARGDTVEWYDSNKFYDLVYMSRVFTDTYSKDYEGNIKAYHVIKGGTGYGLDNKLPDAIEHTPGTEAFEDVGIDILSGKRIDLDILEYIPDIKGNPQAMEVIAELVAKLPEMEIDGHMSEEFEAKVWEKRMPDLTPAEQLAVEIDRFTYDYDTALYHDNSQSMTENVSELAEALKQRDTHDIAMWLADVVTEGTELEETKKAMELLEKLTDYKPLAKIEEMEEQNYNMVDNVLNNGAGEKAQKEENKKEQERPAARISLKARLAEKKALVSGQGKDHAEQENAKKNQREM